MSSPKENQPTKEQQKQISVQKKTQQSNTTNASPSKHVNSNTDWVTLKHKKNNAA